MKSYTNENIALSIAKACDLDAHTMHEVLDDLENGKAADVLYNYGDKLNNELINTIKQNFLSDLVFEYYEIENTVSEYVSKVTGRYTTEECAREALKNTCDWYRAKGTGTIYKVLFKVMSDGLIIRDRTEIFRSK